MACGKWLVLIMLNLFNHRFTLLLFVNVMNEFILVFAPFIFTKHMRMASIIGHIPQYIRCEEEVRFTNDNIRA